MARLPSEATRQKQIATAMYRRHVMRAALELAKQIARKSELSREEADLLDAVYDYRPDVLPAEGKSEGAK